MAISSVATATKLVGLRNTQRLEREWILDEAQSRSVATRQLEGAIHIAQHATPGPPVRLPLFSTCSAKIDGQHFGIIFGIEAHAALLIPPAKLMVVGDVSVVDDSQIGIAVAPERLRVAEIHDRLGGQAGVPDAVRTLETRDAVCVFQVFRASRFA